MSLNKIGKATTLAKALDSFKLGGSISDTISSLRAFGNVNDAAKYLAKNRGSLPDATSIWMLQQAYGKNSMVEETMQSELSKNQIVQNEGIGKSAGLFASFKNVGSGIATVFKSIAPMMIPLIIGAVGIKAGKMLWDNVLTDNAAQKNLQESVQKYKTEKSDLDNLQSQKETNKQRVYELRAKSNRTSAEDNELNNLLNEDSILDTQIGLKKRTVTSAQKQQALDAKKALEKRTFQGELFGKSPYPVYQDTNIGYAQKLMSGLEDEKQARKDVLNNKEWSSERKEAELKAKDKTIASYETELADVMSDISSNAQDLYDEDGNLIDKKNTQDLANNINDLFKAYSMLTNSSDYVSDKMDNIFALSKFSNLKDKLIEAGKSGGTDAIKDLISQTKDLDEAMSNAGIDADDLADGIMAIADPDAKNLEGIKDNLKDIFGKKYSFFKDKNDEDIEGFWDYLQDNNLNPEKMKWGKKDISDNWEDYLNSKKSTEIVDDTTFASRFKNSAEDTATDLDTITDNFQTDMSNIKSSMDSIKSGTFQNSDVTDLIQQFPELATETDNLQQGLQNLAFDKASDAIGKIRDSVKDVTDPKQLAAADKYVQSIMDTMDLSGFDLDKKTVKNLLTNNFTGKNNGPITLDQGFTVSKLMDLYGDDELALQAIVKLSADPSMADADWETWKSKIEDTKVQIQLDTSAKNLDNLSKELTRLQTDASDQQTRLNNKSAYNMKATASDYTNLIENGDKQIENLNNQIKEYQNNIDALKNSKGLSPLSDEDNEQIKQWQDQIQASQMSIENMKASQADWTKTAFNLPVTDMQNTVTALTSAISEMQTETGLTSDTMDSLRTQFSDLKDAHVDNVFDRTAKGLKINTERMKDYLEQQNEFMNSDFAQRIQDYQDQLSAGNKDYTQQGLENLKNLQAQYFAQYQEAAKQFSNFQAMVNADNLSTEGNEYTTAKSYLDTSVPWSGVTEKPSSYPPASHNHDERYYTETEMNSKLAEKATKVHTHTKSEVGLGNVDNTADATKSVKYAISAGSASSAAALTSNAGSSTQPVYFSGGKPVACSYTLGKSVPADALFTDHTYGNMKGATSSSAGSAGLVPAPNIGEQLKFLRADGTWVIPTNTTYSVGTSSYLGITKLYTETGSATDGTMTQNAITSALNGKSPTSHTHNYAGSSSSGGAATSAIKLSTPRKIGNASFDGTADITLSQMGLNVPVEITKANYLAKKKAGTLNANTYYNVIDEYDSANVINDSSVTTNSTFSSTKSEKTYAKKSTLVNTTLTASKWTGSSAPYTYVLPVSGATTSNIVEINYASNASSQAIEAYQNAMLADGGQTTNQITIKATEKPTVDIPITIVIRNDL